MKRRRLKKQIPKVVAQLFSPTRKYLAASARVSQDVLYSYQRAIEICVVDLMRIHLILDPSWPHRERWLDGLDEEFSWEKKSEMLYGCGKLFWGHWPQVGQGITGLPLQTMLKLCPRHGIEYRLNYEVSNEVKSFSNRRWCRTNPQIN